MLKRQMDTNLDKFGTDLKQARKAMGLTRKKLAEMVHIVPRYLANIENNGAYPSLAVFSELIKICCLPIERYFGSETELQNSPVRERVIRRLSACPEKYLPIIEATIEGAIRMDETEVEDDTKIEISTIPC